MVVDPSCQLPLNSSLVSNDFLDGTMADPLFRQGRLLLASIRFRSLLMSLPESSPKWEAVRADEQIAREQQSQSGLISGDEIPTHPRIAGIAFPSPRRRVSETTSINLDFVAFGVS